MTEDKDDSKSWIWNLALLGILIASVWWLMKSLWQLLQLLCGYDRKRGEFSVWTAVGAWLGIALLGWLLVALAT